MRYHSKKSEAVAEAKARRAAGETVKVFRSSQLIPGSGKTPRGYVAVRYYVKAVAEALGDVPLIRTGRERNER